MSDEERPQIFSDEPVAADLDLREVKPNNHWHESYEYRVRAIIGMTSRESDPGDSAPVATMYSDWDDRPDFVARLAQDLRDEYDCTVSIERRRRDETVDFGHLRTRGDSG